MFHVFQTKDTKSKEISCGTFPGDTIFFVSSNEKACLLKIINFR
jgi:hypothetical protein